MFSNEQLQDLIAGKIIGNTYPFDTSNVQEIEAHIRRLFHRINCIPHLICEAEWNHFGSGYASFVELFCYLKEDVIVFKEKDGIREQKTKGIIIDICRLAPVVIMGEDDRYKKIEIKTNDEVSGAYGTLLEGPKRLYLSEKLQPMAKKLKQALNEYDFELLEAENINKLLPFQTTIPTIYREPRDYLIMDAIFYWED